MTTKGNETCYLMSIKPKYAKAIYEGRKNWEFRKCPPPVGKWILLYESAPVCKITGQVFFMSSITAFGVSILNHVRGAMEYTKNLPGVSANEIEDYTGEHWCTALRVMAAEKFDNPPKTAEGFRPPQNWCKVVVTKKEEGGAK